MAASARETWATAQRIRRAVVKETDRIQKSAPDSSAISRLKELEAVMATYRLACIQTLWIDFQYATDEKVEIALWQTHIVLNSVYRKLLNKLSSPQQVVLKRKLEKVYKNYLKTSQFFYKGFMQRMCARYDMPELKRIARGAQLGSMNVPEEDRIDAAAAGIGEPVISSCHHALTYMGDLSRYSTLALSNNRNFEAALTFYSLANDLLPDSGYAYHQMGLIFLEEKNHVEIVYHFYRAMAAAKPHPNASGNLEVEFRDLLRPAAPRTRNPYDAFTSWFVRLHAYFHRGEAFTQRAELEDEVLHRFRMALKAGDFGPTLLKMALINICAYQVAQDKIKTKWTAAGSRSCQFILGFNVRTIHVIACALRSELLDLNNHRREAADEVDEARARRGRSRKFNPAVDARLPLLRVYMTWLCAYRLDVVQFQEHLEPYVGDMYKTLSQALSGLLELLDDKLDSEMPAQYLFPEDTETLGLRCLNDADLHPACRLSVDPIKHTRKPRVEELGGLNVKPDDVSFTRALDIVACAMILARDDTFPFAISAAAKGSSTPPQVVFLEEGKGGMSDYSHAGASDPVDPTTAIGSLAAMFNNLHASPIAMGGDRPRREPSVDGGEGRVASGGPSRTASGHNAQYPPTPHQDPAEVPRQMTPDPEYTMDSKLYDLVDDLLAPPKPQSEEVTYRQDETSYGMHSSTANDVFGSATVSPAPGSATKKSFPNLPWNYFYTPTPQKPYVADGHLQDAFNGALRQTGTRSGSAANGSAVQGFDGLDDPFTLRSEAQMMDRHKLTSVPGERHGFGAQGLAFHEKAHQPFALSNTAGTWNHGAGWDSLEATPMLGQPGNAGQSRPASGEAHSHIPSPMPPVGAPFSSLTFSMNNSSLPPVNSPWGMPAKPNLDTSHSSGFVSPDMQSHGQYVAVGSQSNNPNQGFLYNKGYGYNAAEAAGLGHLPAPDGRNYTDNSVNDAVLDSSAAESEAYDRRVFYGASADGYKPKR